MLTLLSGALRQVWKLGTLGLDDDFAAAGAKKGVGPLHHHVPEQVRSLQV